MANSTDGVSDSDASVISASKAYSLIQGELKKASSIGVDAGSEAIVDDPSSTDVYSSSNTQISFTITEGTVKTTQGLQMGLHVGADADETNKITFNIDTMSSAGLGVQDLNLVDKTGAKATYAIDAIADAIQKVSAQRSSLGAIQNRLEHTINNLDNVVENTTSAESQIRDTDMAEEMVEYSKNNILAQAGQSMLAQANQATQGVLSLLQ
jgi:flagellin